MLGLDKGRSISALNQPSALSAAEGDRRESNGEAKPWDPERAKQNAAAKRDLCSPCPPSRPSSCPS